MADTFTWDTISTPRINEYEFKTLVNELISNSVSGDNTPLKEMQASLKSQLDDLGDQLDAVQKAGIMAKFARDSYADINKQAMSTAMTLLADNEKFKLEAKQMEATYNKAKAEIDASMISKQGVELDNETKRKELIAYDKKIEGLELANLKVMAELKKQMGVEARVGYKVGNGDGNYDQVKAEDGTLEWYKRTASIGYWMSRDAVQAWNDRFVRTYISDSDDTKLSDAQVDDLNDWISKDAMYQFKDSDGSLHNWNTDNTVGEANDRIGQWNAYHSAKEYGKSSTLDPASANAWEKGEKVPVDEKVIVKEVINSKEPGAIDKQIEGFDKVHEKDVMKGLQELASMFVNARQAPADWIGSGMQSIVKQVVPEVNLGMSTKLTQKDV